MILSHVNIDRLRKLRYKPHGVRQGYYHHHIVGWIKWECFKAERTKHFLFDGEIMNRFYFRFTYEHSKDKMCEYTRSITTRGEDIPAEAIYLLRQF